MTSKNKSDVSERMAQEDVCGATRGCYTFQRQPCVSKPKSAKQLKGSEIEWPINCSQLMGHATWHGDRRVEKPDNVGFLVEQHYAVLAFTWV